MSEDPQQMPKQSSLLQPPAREEPSADDQTPASQLLQPNDAGIEEEEKQE